MIILEKPYVSDFLQQTVVRLQIPVLETEFSRSLSYSEAMNLLAPDTFFSLLEKSPIPLLYSNSENSIEQLNAYSPDHPLTKMVNTFKDKGLLREMFSVLNPDVWHRTFKLEQLDYLDLSTLELPFVIKPARGFASIGIHAVHTRSDWKHALESIHKEVRLMKHVFPETVVSLDTFLIERYLDGPEIAIDAYFNKDGEPVILDILTHLYASPSDTSDRLYLTSAEMVLQHHDAILAYLKKISSLRDLRNFPFHLEMRQVAEGDFVPIEINPMRFMGFCVADVEYYFYGINPYEHYFLQKKPDWNRILETRKNKMYGMFGIDIPKHLDKSSITFNYEKFIAHFSKPLHYLKMDYRKFPIAIYLFAEVEKSNFSEFESILYSDLSEFIEPLSS